MPVPIRSTKPTHLILASWTFAAIVALSPFRGAAHIAPFLMVVGFMVVADREARISCLRRTVLLVLAIGTWAVATRLFNASVTWQGLLLWGVTWSGWLALILPLRSADVLEALPRIEALSLWLTGACGVLGIVQLVYGGLREGTLDVATGDYVDGFVHPWLGAAGTFANTTFSAAMVTLLLILLGAFLRTRQQRYLVAACFAAVVIGLASVLHQIAFLILGLVIASCLATISRRTLRHVPAAGAVIACLIVVTVGLHPRNVRAGSRQTASIAVAVTDEVDAASVGHARTVSQESKSAAQEAHRSQAIAQVYAGMSEAERGKLAGFVYRDPNAKITLLKGIVSEGRKGLGPVLIGWGPSSFASRAAAIRSGLYFGSPKSPRALPGLRPELAPLFEEHLLHPWLRVVFASAKFGSTHKPFSSWMSVLSELGLIGIAVVALLGCMATLPRRRNRNIWAEIVLVTTAGFFFLLGFQEHYWEMPQIALLPLLTIRMYYPLAKSSR